MTEIQRYIHKVVDGKNLTMDESSRAFQIIMSGGATPAQVASLVTALKMKGEVVDEIAGAASAMRIKAKPFPITEDLKSKLVDTCGTGGDGKDSYNISTGVAIVLAACGVPVAKHGNKAVSSRAGSSDVFKALGVNIDASEKLMARALAETNLCFLMAPRYHSAMRHVAPTRQELGMRTIFNILGPISNPAGAKRQLLGVYHKDLLVPMAEALKQLGSIKAWVVHGNDGMDELTVTGPTFVAELKEGRIHEFKIYPEECGVLPQLAENLKGGDAEENAAALRRAIQGHEGALYEIIVLNAGAALVVADKVKEIKEGVQVARDAIAAKKADQVLDKFIAITNEERPTGDE